MADCEAHFRFSLDPDVKAIGEFAHNGICRSAKFRLDTEMICRPGDVFELVNGQWFLHRNNEVSLIEGMWLA